MGVVPLPRGGALEVVLEDPAEAFDVGLDDAVDGRRESEMHGERAKRLEDKKGGTEGKKRGRRVSANRFHRPRPRASCRVERRSKTAG